MALATNLAVLHTAPVRASAYSSRKSEPQRRKAAAANWWSPIFGWSSEPDYVSGSGNEPVHFSDPEVEAGRQNSRFMPGCFTEEKAKLLRKKTLESSTFHDLMYHSAIASRLASDSPDRSKK